MFTVWTKYFFLVGKKKSMGVYWKYHASPRKMLNSSEPEVQILEIQPTIGHKSFYSTALISLNMTRKTKSFNSLLFFNCMKWKTRMNYFDTSPVMLWSPHWSISIVDYLSELNVSCSWFRTSLSVNSPSQAKS